MSLFGTSTYNLIDPILNWGISFRYNPLYLLFFEVNGGKEISYLPLSYLLFCQAFFFLPILVGLFLKFRFSLPFVIGAFLSFFFSLFVRDFQFWSALHELPFVMIILGQLKRFPQFKFLLTFLSALLWGWCSGPLGFLGSFLILWMIRGEGKRVKGIFLATALSASVLFLVPFPLPSYPDGAQISEISLITFWPTELWGPSVIPSPLEPKEYYTRLSSYFSTAVTNILLILALLIQLKNKGRISKELHVILLTSAFLFFESSFGGKVTQNLATVMYGLVLMPFPRLISSLGVLIGLGLFINSDPDERLPFNLGFIILVFFYLSNLITSPEGEVAEAQQIGTQFSKKITTDPSKIVPVNVRFTALHATEIRTNVSQDEAKFVADRNWDTKWTSNTAMIGNEVIDIKLRDVIDCTYLTISPGSSKTDFPRGIKVEVTHDNSNYLPAASVENWKGPIRITNEGNLYFASQDNVELRLDNAEKITGLKIYQTGKDDFYYWTVAEVRCGRL